MTPSSPTKSESPTTTQTAFDFLDLKAQFATIREEVVAAVSRVLESQYFILGPEVTKFEEEVAAKLGAKYAIACASGTDALVLALMAAKIGPGDEVITTPIQFHRHCRLHRARRRKTRLRRYRPGHF